MVNKLPCKYCGKLYSSKGLGTHIWRTHGDGKSFNPNAGYIAGTRSAWNKGLNKYNDDSVAAISAHLKRKKSELELKLDDDGKLRQKWFNKQANAKQENISFELSYDEFMSLVNDAGLRSSQLGFSGQGYVLARINDTGSYSINNCRFLTQKENAAEKKISDKMRASSRKNMLEVNKHPEYRRKALEGYYNSEYYKNRKLQAEINRKHRESLLDARYCGPHNSQTGTYWITDGKINKKWKQDKGEIPEGFHRGRKM